MRQVFPIKIHKVILAAKIRDSCSILVIYAGFLPKARNCKTDGGRHRHWMDSHGGLRYPAWQRPEQAVDYHRQSVDIHSQLGDKRHEGVARSNLANTLIKLKRLDAARPELLCAIECKKSFGHAAEPWTTWAILYNLERADNNPQATQQARQQAIQTFRDYRRDGGENHSSAGRLSLAVFEAIQQQTTEIEQGIAHLLEQEEWQAHRTYLDRLLAIIAGERVPALAEDDQLRFDLVVELQMLLEQLA